MLTSAKYGLEQINKSLQCSNRAHTMLTSAKHSLEKINKTFNVAMDHTICLPLQNMALTKTFILMMEVKF